MRVEKPAPLRFFIRPEIRGQRPMRKVLRFRRAPEIPEGMVYILEVCQHEVPKPTPDTLVLRCPLCPPE